MNALAAFRGLSGLGDAGASNDDASYTGDTGDSYFSMQYYRDKASQFQTVMDALDQAYGALQDAYVVEDDPDACTQMESMMDQFDSKRNQFRMTAEAINAGAWAVNNAGGRFPELSIPPGLGLVQIPAGVLLGAAAVAALSAAYFLIQWALVWTRTLADYLETRALALTIDDPDKRAAYLTATSTAREAASAAELSPISAAAQILKYGVIAFGVYFAWKIIEGK